MTSRTYSSPEAFKQALEQRLRASARHGAELTRKPGRSRAALDLAAATPAAASAATAIMDRPGCAGDRVRSRCRFRARTRQGLRP